MISMGESGGFKYCAPYKLPSRLCRFLTSFACTTQLGHHIAMVSTSTTFPAKSSMVKVSPVCTSVSSKPNHSGLLVSAVGVGVELHAAKNRLNSTREKTTAHVYFFIQIYIPFAR